MRWHTEAALMLRRWRKELANHARVRVPERLAPPSEATGMACHCARGIGTMRKRRPYECQKRNCFCKLDKRFRPGIAQLRMDSRSAPDQQRDDE